MVVLYEPAKNYYSPFIELDEVLQNLLAMVHNSSERKQAYLSGVE